MSLSTHVIKTAKAILSGANQDNNVTLNNTLRLLAKWRSVIIQNTMIANHGTVIHGGPFIGMQFLHKSAEGCHVAKLLGCYEQPLHKYFTAAALGRYDRVINIGCAEGYYAVGIARLSESVMVDAYDTDEVARESCTSLARNNNVSDRVNVYGAFSAKSFADYTGQKCLVLCDVEGAEKELLDINACPEMRKLDFIIESHECLVPGITDELISRFSHTHRITKILDIGSRRVVNPPEWFVNLSHLDQLLATWEWRSGPTPWLVLETL